MKILPVCRQRVFALGLLALLLCGVGARAALTAKDDESDFPVRGEIPLKNWAQLMEETNTPPIVIPPTSRLAGADNPKQWEWMMATLLQPAFNGYLKPDDAEARAFWVKAARYYMYKEPSEPDAAFNTRLSQVQRSATATWTLFDRGASAVSRRARGAGARAVAARCRRAA